MSEPIEDKEKSKKLITEDNVTMTGCINALKKLRNCVNCPFRFDKEKCKAQKCVPQPVINVIEFAIRQYFLHQKEIKAMSKQNRSSKKPDSVDPTITERTDVVNDLNI